MRLFWERCDWRRPSEGEGPRELQRGGFDGVTGKEMGAERLAKGTYHS